MPKITSPKAGVALVLTCMDLRVVDEAHVHMHEKKKLRDEYDHVALAGAALGAISPAKKHWNKTFWDHVALAKKLHGVREVHIFEHQDCGAYELLLDAKERRRLRDPDDEIRIHHEKATKLARRLEKRAGLKAELFYIRLVRGSVGEVCRFEDLLDRSARLPKG